MGADERDPGPIPCAGESSCVIQDVRYGLRMLRKSPGFTSVVILTLALGVGASTAIYSVVNTVLLNPVPGPQPEQLVQIAERLYTQGNFKEQNNQPFFCGVSAPALEGLRSNQDLFAQFAWQDSLMLERKTDDFVELESGAKVSSDFFQLWGIKPALGRTFARDETTAFNPEGRPTRDSPIVLSHEWWKTFFGGDPAILGRTVELSGRQFTVIGVMPSYFQFPAGYTRFWVAAEPDRLPPGWVSGPNTRVLARLKPGVTIQQVQAMLDTVAARIVKDLGPDARGYAQEWRRRPQGLGFWVRPLRQEFQGAYGADTLQHTLFGLVGAIGFVLLIACANVANLTLARTEKRQQELAVRAALGAGRARLVRQLLTESFLLASLAGLASLALTAWGIKLLASLVPESMPRLEAIGVNGHVLCFTLLVSMATALLFGLAPAWRGGGTALGDAIKQAGSGATASTSRSRYRSTLVVVEVALAIVLLAGAGLMIESVRRLLHVDPGFDPENLLYVNIELPWKTYNDQEDRQKAAELRTVAYTAIQERISALPGVKAVAIGKHGAWPERLTVTGRAEPVELLRDGCSIDEGDLFRAMRVPLLAGRYLDRHDLGEAAGTAIINETMARTCWPGENAIGKSFGGASPYGNRTYEVVGVVGDVRDYRFDQQLRPTFFRPCAELNLEGMRPFVVVRTQTDPRTLIPAIRRELKAVEPAMRMPTMSVARQVLYDSTQAQRTYMRYLIVFAGVGMSLSGIGIYGVLAYSVARRTREIGIRVAVGAEQRHVLAMVMGEGARLVCTGAIVGLLAAFWLTRLLRNQLFEVQPADPSVLAAAVLLLLAVASLACYLPARRATRIDPMVALRYE